VTVAERRHWVNAVAEIFEITNGTSAGALEVHTYDLGARGMFVVGLRRPAP
jgi:hypothetical protein